MGHVMRSDEEDPMRQVTFIKDTASPVKPEKNRVGRPMTHWKEGVMEKVWDKLEAWNNLQPLEPSATNPTPAPQGTRETFNIDDDNHRDMLLELAKKRLL